MLQSRGTLGPAQYFPIFSQYWSYIGVNTQRDAARFGRPGSPDGLIYFFLLPVFTGIMGSAVPLL